LQLHSELTLAFFADDDSSAADTSPMLLHGWAKLGSQSAADPPLLDGITHTITNCHGPLSSFAFFVSKTRVAGKTLSIMPGPVAQRLLVEILIYTLQ
jgi:hypothetical protein